MKCTHPSQGPISHHCAAKPLLGIQLITQSRSKEKYESTLTQNKRQDISVSTEFAVYTLHTGLYSCSHKQQNFNRWVRHSTVWTHRFSLCWLHSCPFQISPHRTCSLGQIRSRQRVVVTSRPPSDPFYFQISQITISEFVLEDSNPTPFKL